MGRSTQGVKFVTPKSGDSVAVVARSVEAKVEEEVAEEAAAGSGPTAAGRGIARLGRGCNNRGVRHDRSAGRHPRCPAPRRTDDGATRRADRGP